METSMPATDSASNVTAPTQFVEVDGQRYAYRRFGAGSAPALLCLQHFTGTLDNWDSAVTDPLAAGREVILFESAGLGRSTGTQTWYRSNRRLRYCCNFGWPQLPRPFLDIDE